MIVPFGYAFAGIWQRRFKEWITPALPWTLFAVMILGTGIIMGSFWAYEALNFGGFWAWDPVENASIIPWLTLIGALHVMIAYKNTGHAYFTAIVLVFISFILVLYASFLTRSGILGETSVHSFTDLGMFGHLILYNVVFLLLGAWFIIIRWKELPISPKDEETYSREFWMFIGALVVTLACVQLIFSTSVPVFNAVFGTNYAPPLDPVEFYNKRQTPGAILILLISGFSQYLKYKRTDPRRFYSSLISSVLISLILTGLVAYFANVYGNPMYILLTFAVVAAAAWPMWNYVMHDYQKKRVLTLVDPEADKWGAGWNILQSKTAIGSGGIEGKGWMKGTQSQLDFLPESHTDFIIAVLAEEFGLQGVLALLACYLFVIGRGLVIAWRATTTFGRILSGSISLTFLIYVFVNMGMVSGLLPIVGVPLPMVSLGGTSLITLMMSFGLLMAVANEGRR
ncbi:MAG: hypothetical protein EOP51_29725 [Sphingobacteriales bacterium]|nr:MAG: hypothetical protein EOP51_29725 [Sphingobacteriales bacterium]